MTPLSRHLLPAYMTWLAENRLDSMVHVMVKVSGMTARHTTSGKQVSLALPGEEVVQINLSKLVAGDLKISKDTSYLTFITRIEGKEALVTIHLDALINVELPVTPTHSVYAPLGHGVPKEEIQKSLKARKPNLEVVR